MLWKVVQSCRKWPHLLKLLSAEVKMWGRYDCSFNLTELKKPIEFSAAGEFLSGHVSVPIRFRDRPH